MALQKKITPIMRIEIMLFCRGKNEKDKEKSRSYTDKGVVVPFFM